MSEDRLTAEFKAVAAAAGVTLYDLRHACTQSVKDAGLPHLELRFLTSYSVSNIRTCTPSST